MRRVPKTITRRGQQYAARRAILERAAELLETYARHKVFAPSYSRMNPAANLKANTFYFGETHRPPRAVIFGPWLYIHAPGILLPNEVTRLARGERRRKHLGALHARLALRVKDDLKLVDQTARCLVMAGIRPAKD